MISPHRDLGASGPVLGGGRCWGVSFFGFIVHLGFPPVQHATTAGLPRTGGCLKKVAAADAGLPEVPLGFFGNPPSGGSSPLRGSFGDFRGGLLGPVGLHVACLPHLHSASGRVGRVCSLPRLGPGRSIGGSNPCFQHG